MFLVKEVSTEEATTVWQNSVSASLFTCPEFLNNLSLKTRFLGGYKNDDLLVIWPLVESENGFNSPPAFSYYFGPYWIKNNSDEKPYKKYRNNLEVLNCLVEKIVSIAPKIKFSVSPEFLDLRPFQWWNYHNPKDGQFKINLKYTAKYILDEIIDEEQIINSFRLDDKRKKVKQIIKQGNLITKSEMSQPISFYIEIYKKTILRSGGTFKDKELNFLIKIIELCKKKMF